MGAIEEARARLEVEVRDNVHETPNPSKNEGWIAATMQAADEYAMAVAKEMLPPRSHTGPKTWVESRYVLIKAHIAALGPQERPDPPQEEGA